MKLLEETGSLLEIAASLGRNFHLQLLALTLARQETKYVEQELKIIMIEDSGTHTHTCTYMCACMCAHMFAHTHTPSTILGNFNTLKLGEENPCRREKIRKPGFFS